MKSISIIECTLLYNYLIENLLKIIKKCIFYKKLWASQTSLILIGLGTLLEYINSKKNYKYDKNIFT